MIFATAKTNQRAQRWIREAQSAGLNPSVVEEECRWLGRGKRTYYRLSVPGPQVREAAQIARELGIESNA